MIWNYPMRMRDIEFCARGCFFIEFFVVKGIQPTWEQQDMLFDLAKMWLFLYCICIRRLIWFWTVFVCFGRALQYRAGRVGHPYGLCTGRPNCRASHRSAVCFSHLFVLFFFCVCLLTGILRLGGATGVVVVSVHAQRVGTNNVSMRDRGRELRTIRV